MLVLHSQISCPLFTLLLVISCDLTTSTVSVDWPNIPYPLFPSVFISLSPLLGTWLFLAADWSRTVSASPLNCLIVPAPLFGLAQPLCLRLFTEAVTTLPPPFSDLSFSLSLVRLCVGCVCPSVSLAFAPSFPLPFLFCLFSALSLPFSPCSLSVLRYLECCAWSFWPQTGPDFQRHPHFPLSSLPPPFPGEAFSFFVIQIVPGWYFWPQTGQGITPLVSHYPSNSALSLAADWSRAVAL